MALLRRSTVMKKTVDPAAVLRAQQANREEFARKIFHTLPGFLTFFLFKCGFETFDVALCLLPFTISGTVVEFIRFQNDFVNGLYIRFLGFMLRREEVRKMNSAIFYLYGVELALLCFPKPVAVCSIMFLAYCDPAASTFGRMYGHLTPKLLNGKSLMGTVAAVITGMIVSSAVFSDHSVVNVLGRGLIAGISELIPVPSIRGNPLDDNLTIPSVSGILLLLLHHFQQYNVS